MDTPHNRTWEEWQELIAKVKAEDHRRILAGELKQSDLFWLDAERVRNATVTFNWKKKCPTPTP